MSEVARPGWDVRERAIRPLRVVLEDRYKVEKINDVKIVVDEVVEQDGP
jgi:hypothetical protein